MTDIHVQCLNARITGYIWQRARTISSLHLTVICETQVAARALTYISLGTQLYMYGCLPNSAVGRGFTYPFQSARQVIRSLETMHD